MKVKLRVLKPTPLALLMLGLLFLFQWIYFSGTYTTYDYAAEGQPPIGSVSIYGIFQPVTVTTLGADTTVDVLGVWLSGNIALSYALALLLALVFSKVAPRLERPERIYGAVTAAMVAATFLLSVTWSKSYWGYYFVRPAMLAELQDVTAVRAVVPVETVTDEFEARTVVLNEDYDLAERLAYARESPYYAHGEGMLLTLEDKGRLPESTVKTLEDIPPLYPLVMASGLVATPDEGYTHSDLFWGVAIDALNARGERMLLLGLSGGQVSNDHFPYYELLFTAPAGTRDFTFVRGQRYFYDNAGIEGVEWYTLWFIGLIPAIVIGLLATALVLAIRDISWRLRLLAEQAERGILDIRLRWRIAIFLMPTPMTFAMFVLVLLLQCGLFVFYITVQSWGVPWGGPIGELVSGAVARVDDSTMWILKALALLADPFISYVTAAMLARSYGSATGSQ